MGGKEYVCMMIKPHTQDIEQGEYTLATWKPVCGQHSKNVNEDSLKTNRNEVYYVRDNNMLPEAKT